ncbi:transcription factor Adf-1-like [Diorhabda sublineata]|uniref:transcription factor Adf-1-like n=1 Tax=Diorhabda sublineata TaxID=1163346 RepID=UPI0024E16187|nr:transcription factor Adf-1-like [Diorhabda sublineata]
MQLLLAVKFFTKLMYDEKLIELVRKYPVIYNTGHAKYLDTKHTLRIWNKIGEEIQQTGSICKSRWQNIRDQFRKNLAKKVTKSGQTAEKRKRYEYEDCLQFLIPFFAERDTLSNVTLPNSESTDDILHHEVTEDEGSQLHATQPTRDNNLDTISHTETEDHPRLVIKRLSVPTKTKLPEQQL